MPNFNIANPERPEGSDIKGKFLGTDVDLRAGENKDYPQNVAEALKKRYPWLAQEDAEGNVKESIPAEEGGEETLTEEEEAEDKAKEEAGDSEEDEEDEDEEVEVKDLNVKELKAELKERKIKFPKDAKKPELAKLLTKALEDEASEEDSK